jgi:hypothetical protein
VNGPGSTIRDRHSLGKTHSLQVNYSSMLGKNSPDSPWLMFYFLREDALPDLTDVSGRMAQMTQFVS